jgi:hypothetical protein
MICYELFSGRKPFGQIHPIEAARRASLDNARPQWTPSHVNKYVCCPNFGASMMQAGHQVYAVSTMPAVSNKAGWGLQAMVFCVLRSGTRIPEELVQLVESCWSPDFEDRPEVLPRRFRACGCMCSTLPVLRLCLCNLHHDIRVSTACMNAQWLA